MSDEIEVRQVRVLIYEGPASWVQRVIENKHRYVQGQKIVACNIETGKITMSITEHISEPRAILEPTLPSKFAVVNTDNYGGDYPNEEFIGPEYETEQAAREAADKLNGTEQQAMYADRYHKVVKLPYKLLPGFTP